MMYFNAKSYSETNTKKELINKSLEVIESLKGKVDDDELSILIAGILKNVVPKKPKICKDKMKWCELAINKKESGEVLRYVNWNEDEHRIEATDGEVLFLVDGLEGEKIKDYPEINRVIPEKFSNKLINFENMYTCIKSMTEQDITFDLKKMNRMSKTHNVYSTKELCLSRENLAKVVKMGGNISVSWNDGYSPVKFENEYGMSAIVMPKRNC